MWFIQVMSFVSNLKEQEDFFVKMAWIWDDKFFLDPLWLRLKTLFTLNSEPQQTWAQTPADLKPNPRRLGVKPPQT